MTNEPGTPDANEKRDEDAHPEQPRADSRNAFTFANEVHGQGHIFGDHGRIESVYAYLSLVLTVPLVPFLHSFMSKAGEDAYLALKMFVRRRLKTEEQDRLILEDANTHIRVEVTAELPDEAFQQLLRIDPAELAQPDRPIEAPLRWEPVRGGWAPPS